jgi:hypothetical protein
MSKLAVLGAGAALLLAAAPASAVTIFADFTPATNSPNIQYSGALNGVGVVTDLNQLVHFSFLNPDGSVSGTSFDAWMSLTATTGAGTTVSGLAVLPVLTGSMTFTAASPVTWGGHTGTNLLTVNFTGGAFTGLLGGSTATYGNSTPPNVVNFTSDFLDFTGTNVRDLALAVDAINPPVGSLLFGARLHTGSVSGNFGADISSGNPQGVVPEPGSWALMFAGFGLVGSALRTQRRRRSEEVSFG